MSYGLALNNSNGKRVIGSDTVLPRFVAKYTETTLDINNNYGDFLKYAVVCDGKPMCFLHVPVGFSASVNRVIETSTGNYDVFVYIPYTTTTVTYGDIHLYVFTDGNTTSSTSGYGMTIKKADGEVAYDTGYSHASIKHVLYQARHKWVVVGTNEASNFISGDTVYNKTRGTNTVVAITPYTNVLEVSTSPTDVTTNWVSGDVLAKTATGTTVATISATGVIASQSKKQVLGFGGTTTWSTLGISKPAFFSQRSGQGFMAYYRKQGTQFAQFKFSHLYYRSSISYASDGIVWGMYATRLSSEANAAMSVGTYDNPTHSLYDNCVCCASCPISNIWNDYYGTVSWVTWNISESDIITYVIDGADYD
jgi:hypothetical protein